MTTMTSALPEILGRVAETWLPIFLDASAKGVVLLSVAGCVALLLHRGSAATRHLVWALGLSALLLLPALRVAGPQWRVDASLFPRGALPLASEGVGAPASVGDEARPPSWPAAGGSRGSAVVDDPLPPGPDADEAADRDRTGVGGLASGNAAGGGEAPPRGSEDRSAGDTGAGPASGSPGQEWPTQLLLVWAVGALGLLGRLAAGFVRVGVLARGAEAVTDPGLLARVRTLSARLDLRKEVRLLVGPGGAVPMTWGLFRPTLLLPVEARDWPSRRLDHVLLHELAHVKRRDHAIQVLAELALALHWMNPLAWVATQRTRVERERACDDRVLEAGCRPSGYARDLLAVARSLRHPGTGALVAAPMARSTGLGDRLRAILDAGRPRRGPDVARTAASGAVALAVALPLAAISPSPTEAEGPAPSPPPIGEVVEGAVPTPQSGEMEPTPEEGEPGLTPESPPEASPILEALEASPPLSAAGPPQTTEVCVFRGRGPQSTRMNVDDDRATIEWSTDDCSVKVEIRGDVEFAPDDRSVTRIPPGGLLDLEEEARGQRRRIRMEPGSGGAPVIEYRLNGEVRPFDPGAREWLATLLPELFRHTTINAEARARRILGQEGAEGLLREIERIESDHVARVYFEHLLTMAELDDDELREILRIAGQRLDSDHHRAELLLTLVEREGLGPGLRDAYLDAARGIDSDHHHRRVLERLLREPGLEAATLERVLLASRDLDSDHHRAELLLGVADVGILGAGGREAFLAALEGIDSDHHHRRVLEGFLDQGALSPGELARVLEMTRGIDSDHHLAEILTRVGREHPLTGEAATAYVRSAGRIDSDHHLRRSLEAILENPGLDEAHLGLILEVARQVDSDHHRAELLMAVARDRTLDGDLLSAYLRAAEEIGSRTHRERALEAVGRVGVI